MSGGECTSVINAFELYLATKITPWLPSFNLVLKLTGLNGSPIRSVPGHILPVFVLSDWILGVEKIKLAGDFVADQKRSS